jgi:hypothetical protein
VWVELLAYLAERSVKRGPLFKTQVKKRRMRGVDAGMIVKAYWGKPIGVKSGQTTNKCPQKRTGKK